MKKEEMKYSVKDNVRYMLKNWWDWDKKSFLVCAIRIPAMVFLPMITALIPKLMIDAINNHVEPYKMVLIVGGMSAMVALLSWIDPYLNEIMGGFADIARTRYRIMVFHKTMTTDFVNVESVDGRAALERSKKFTNWFQFGIKGFYYACVLLCVNVLGIVSYLAVMSSLNMGMILVIAVTCLLEFFLIHFITKSSKRLRDNSNKFWMRFDYFYRNSKSVSSGKDVRLYGAVDWFIKIIAELSAGNIRLLRRFSKQEVEVSAVRALLTLIREAVAYIYLIYCVLNDIITVADFIFFFGLVTGFATWILGIASQLQQIETIAAECGKFREYIDYPDVSDKNGTLTADCNKTYSVEFKDVTFTYQGSDEPTIKGMSFSVKPCENIAIVGENGAGKTTAIKILCGLYEPTGGSVLINGVPVSKYDKKSYFSLFSAVYQDFNFLPMSVEKNVALCHEDEINREKLEVSLKHAGIWDAIEQLPEKAKTKMVKEVFDNAAEFSGGQVQKLLLARALYRDAPILVLDEPTSALDPIAENELYEQYNDLTENKTSFFISHRLSSTRFCDRIIFISDGRVTEIGTHEELMAKKGKYWQMYEIQSHYYKEEGVKAQ